MCIVFIVNNVEKVVHLLESPAELKSRVEEAIAVLREHLNATQNAN